MSGLCKECAEEIGLETDFYSCYDPDYAVYCDNCGPIRVNDEGLRITELLSEEEQDAWTYGADIIFIKRDFNKDRLK